MLRYLDVQNILDKNDLILQGSGCVGSENERGNAYMKKIGIVTDSHSSISQEEAEKLGIFVLPMPSTAVVIFFQLLQPHTPSTVRLVRRW